MTNIEIAWAFWEIADLLELKADENPFKIRAYRKAAKTIKHLPIEINELLKEGKIKDLPGIGNDLASKIRELITTGKCDLHQRLKDQIPISLRELLAIPGLGAKTIRLIHQKLGVNNLKDLKIAANNKKLRNIPKIGSKTELNILRGIEMLEQSEHEDIPIGVAMPLAKLFLSDLLQIPGVINGSVCGSIRRGKDMVDCIDLIISSDDPDLVKDTLQKHPQVKKVITLGTQNNTILTWLGVKVQVKIILPESFWLSLHQFTGSAEFCQKITAKAEKLGYSIDEFNLFDTKQARNILITNEKDIYKILNMQYIPPELREDNGEIEAAMTNKLPFLIEKADIKGDLHLHTSWSDGLNDIEEMAQAAIRKGYKYIAITDHSRSLAIAKGLSIERLEQQKTYINELNKQYEELKILSGVEMDILQDARLDYPDEVLEQCDVVIASIHTGLRQEKEKIQARIEAALKNPHVNILAHPTGRILGRRKPYIVNFDWFFDLAKKEGKILEINSSPDRLDLNADYAKKAALDYNIPIAINTDAHDVLRLDDIEYGILTARRGWLSSKNVINTQELNSLKKMLKRG